MSPTKTTTRKPTTKKPATPSLHRQATDLLRLVLLASPYGQVDVGGEGAAIHSDGTFTMLDLGNDEYDADGMTIVRDPWVMTREQFEGATDTDEVMGVIYDLLEDRSDFHFMKYSLLTTAVEQIRAKIDAAKAAAKENA